MTYLPHRHSWKSVSRFIPVFVQLIDQHKRKGTATIMFNPSEMHLSVESAMSRLRDAAQSLLQGLTSHASIDAKELSVVWPLYKVISDGTNVQVVSRQTEQGEPLRLGGSENVLSVLRVEEAGFIELVSAFALLLGRRFLQGQVTIVGDLSDQIRHRLESENDIAIVQDGPQQYHML